MADQWYLRHQRHRPARDRRMANQQADKLLFLLPRHAGGAVIYDLVDVAFAMGTGLRGAAGKPGPRAVPWPRYTALHFDGVRYWFGARWLFRRRLCAPGPVH